LAIAVSVLFLLGFAASAFAIHAEIPSETQAVVAKGETQVTLGGSIRVRGEIRENTTDFNSDLHDSTSWYDQRVRLSAGIKVSDDVSGLIMLESNGGGSDGYIWGPGGNSAVGIYPVGNSKPTDMHINQAWILYTNDLVNVKIGRMPLALGNLLFFDHRKFGDDAIVLYKDIDNIHLAFLTAKLNEGLTGGGADFLCGIDVAPADGVVDDGSPLITPIAGACPAGTAPFIVSTAASAVSTATAGDADAYVALVSYKGDGYNISGDITWVDDNSFGPNTDLYNLGARADIKLSDLVTLRGDVEFQFGSLSDTVDFGGYAFMLGADFDLETLDIGVEAGLGSGDDNPADGDFDMFVNSLSSGVPYIAFVRGTRTPDNSGISNLTYIKATVKASPMDKMTVKGALIYMMLTEELVPGGDDDEGIEIDASMHYNLAKNLKYWVEGGYFMAGDAKGTNADDAYALRHGIELTF
jgi:hypothetical protein